MGGEAEGLVFQVGAIWLPQTHHRTGALSLCHPADNRGVGGGGDSRFNAKTLGIEEMRITGGVDDDTIARFESCDAPGVTLAAPVLIAHTPSKTVVAVSSADRFPQTVWHEQDGNNDHLWALVQDKALLERLMTMAPRSARC